MLGATVIQAGISSGEAILLIVFVAVPLAAFAFAAGATGALRQIGKGGLSLELESDMPQEMRDSGAQAGGAVARDELRQLLEAKAYRQRTRGEQPLDVESELERLVAEQESSDAAGGKTGAVTSPPPPSEDNALREEVRQLVVARNERRQRQGKEPLDVETEVDRQLRELENLGQ